MTFRIEKDSLGEVRVPIDAYYGAQTVRAIENFKVSKIKISHFKQLIVALGCIKEAAAQTNVELRVLDEKIGQAICQAAREVQQGLLDKHFKVEMIQGGAGTSVNMNANEVICNRALEILGHKKGEYEYCHPNNHVNLSQSTNDVFPTAIKLASIWYGEILIEELGKLVKAFENKATEFKDILTMGRTQLQDAVPITLGQEFAAYGVTLAEDIDRIKYVIQLLAESSLGGTAIGTGINTVPGYAERVCANLSKISKVQFNMCKDLIEATNDTGVFVFLSGTLKRLAVKTSKICNDLRLLASGPFAGFGEIQLPAMQPGSSIMPGKVNPVIPELVNQVCFEVIGNDVSVTMAAEGGQLQLNVFEPIIAWNIFHSLIMLRSSFKTLREKCIVGIKANPEKCLEMVKKSNGLITGLVPKLGYDECSRIAKQALKTGDSVYNIVLNEKLMSSDELHVMLDPRNMTKI